MKKLFVSIALVSMLLLCVVVTLRAAETGIRTERVKFAKGATSAVIKGQVKGSGDVDYLVRAGAGQTITVSLKVSNRSELLQRAASRQQGRGNVCWANRRGLQRRSSCRW